MSCYFQDSGVENCWLGIDALQVKHCPASVAWYHSDLDIGFNDPQIGLCLLMYEEYPADTQYIETPAKSMIGSSLLSHVFEQSWVVTARVYPLFPWLLKACSLDMCRLILGLWIFALLLARADIQDSYDSYWQSEAHKMKFECSNHRKSMPPPVVCPLLLTQSFSIGSFTASERETIGLLITSANPWQGAQIASATLTG